MVASPNLALERHLQELYLLNWSVNFQNFSAVHFAVYIRVNVE